MLYHSYEMMRTMLGPLHRTSSRMRNWVDHPANPMGGTWSSRVLAAQLDMMERTTRQYTKPEFGIEQVTVGAERTPVAERVVHALPFCNLLHFERRRTARRGHADPKVLIVAPLSGHFATLLRGTVRAMLPEHDTYITDWRDARDVIVTRGPFTLDDYVDYVCEFVRHLGPNTHVIAVCQPAVPVLVATALLSAQQNRAVPRSLTLMGGPIDTRCNPTAVNEHALAHDLDWFERKVINYVPFPNVGAGRRVYPGFLQLSGFLAMNLDRHVEAFSDYFADLVAGDADSSQAHERFYDEYLAVMDLPAEYFLQTVDRVFQRQLLARGRFEYRGQRVDCAAIEKTALLTIEGEKDDICGLGQTEAAHDLCTGIPASEKQHYVQPGVGHYGVFNGTRWRGEIQPRIRDMIASISR